MTTMPDDAHDLARSLRPQGFGRTRPQRIDDAIVEPAWPGIRVFASVSEGRVCLWEEGDEIDLFDDDVHEALSRATADTVDGAIFDGYVTKQVPSKEIDVLNPDSDYPTMASEISRLFVGQRRSARAEFEQRRRAERAGREFGENDVVNLVLTDLLWLDGEWLLDVPLLERRRVLESVVEPSALVRTGLFVRQPIDSWIQSWRAQGFHGMTFKGANSRYRPGEASNEWAEADLPRR
jgi:hypothetical protein